jgi:hypothetical protein
MSLLPAAGGVLPRSWLCVSQGAAGASEGNGDTQRLALPCSPFGGPIARLSCVRASRAQFPDTFVLPLDPRIVVSGFLVDKCKVHDTNERRFGLFSGDLQMLTSSRS